MFVATWAIALSVWRFGRIEERWTAHLARHRAGRRLTRAEPRGRASRAETRPSPQVFESRSRTPSRRSRCAAAACACRPHGGSSSRPCSRPTGPSAPRTVADAVARRVLGVPQPRGARAARPGPPPAPRPLPRPLVLATRAGGGVPLLRALHHGDGRRARAAWTGSASRSEPSSGIPPRFTHFAIVGTCRECAAAGAGHPPLSRGDRGLPERDRRRWAADAGARAPAAQPRPARPRRPAAASGSGTRRRTGPRSPDPARTRSP